MARLSALSHQDYTVGWIRALPAELTATIAMLDEEYSPLPQHPQDNNTYTPGLVVEHNVVWVVFTVTPMVGHPHTHRRFAQRSTFGPGGS
jgi:hypothetical protein